ncbi:MAG: ABC transporter ATP-binding protein [Parasporobacterium sp.]|nr:ABC transporter ATP-binding protein [Parasporobacterium sp.]
MTENQNTETQKKQRTDWKLLMRFLKGSLHLFVMGVILSAVVSLMDMLTPQVIRMAIDNAISGLEPEYPGFVMTLVNRLGGFSWLGEHLWVMALWLVAIALVRAAAQYGMGVLNNKGSEKLVKTMRDRVFRHIEHLPFSWHMKNHTGDIIQRCTSDVDKIRNFVAEQLSNIIRIVVLLVLSVYFMMTMNIWLTLIAVAVIPLILGYVVLYGKKLHKGFEDCDETEGQVSAMVQENLTGVRVVRAFARERYEKERFETHNAYYCGLWVKMGTVLARFFTVQDILSMLQVLLVVTVGSVFCVRGSMTAGDLVAFISYNALLAWPVRRLGRMLVEMSKADVSIGRIGYIMNSEIETESPQDVEVPMDQTISFEHVSFAYENCPEVLHDISFEIEPGTTVGILGGTGTGKSTLMLLLDKMYDLPKECGTIRIGGTDIREIRTSYLRKQISMVLQEPFLFSRTIRENIGISKEGMTLEDIREAARAACLDENVWGFSKGYETFVGERGVTLSGGQKQRAAIARALTAKTPIMIFDDSLSAVDTETDARIRESLQERFGSATILIISHRLTTISKADKVVILSGGRISEIGTPQELRHSGGLYQKIYEIQSGKEAACE